MVCFVSLCMGVCVSCVFLSVWCELCLFVCTCVFFACVHRFVSAHDRLSAYSCSFSYAVNIMFGLLWVGLVVYMFSCAWFVDIFVVRMYVYYWRLMTHLLPCDTHLGTYWISVYGNSSTGTWNWTSTAGSLTNAHCNSSVRCRYIVLTVFTVLVYMLQRVLLRLL